MTSAARCLYSSSVALPESIPVRYSEEDAEYVTVRPVVRQTFRQDDLLDMILSVTGKDAARIRQILRSGTVAYHFYRYWWSGFEASADDLSAALQRFPDADPSRAFRMEECSAVIFEGGSPRLRQLFELMRKQASQRKFLRSKSLWDFLIETARANPPAYAEYSYAQRADVFRLTLKEEDLAKLMEAAARLAPRNLRAALRVLPQTTRIGFVCPRPKAARRPA